jgi:hypothetical protein
MGTKKWAPVPVKCCLCKKDVEHPGHVLYKVIVLTKNLQGKEADHLVSIPVLEDKMFSWLFDKGIKLSVTQIILGRPDILLKFFKELFSVHGETVVKYGLAAFTMCDPCYNKEYIPSVPEK